MLHHNWLLLWGLLHGNIGNLGHVASITHESHNRLTLASILRLGMVRLMNYLNDWLDG